MTTTHPAFLWINGEVRPWEEATVHVSELGWSTVGAVFEGIRGYWNQDDEELYIFRLREHMERLHRSMRLVRLPIEYTVDQLMTATQELLRANGAAADTYIFPLAYTRDSYTTRYDSLSIKSSLHIVTRPMPSHLNTGKRMTASVSSWRRISEDVMPPRVKNLSNYRNGQLARMESALDGYDTSIILNAQGKVAEAPGACVMFVRDGSLITPDLTSSVLESITRDAILTIAREQLEMPVVERVVDRTELYLADEVFVCGTAAEISPIVEIDKLQIGTGVTGPVTRALEQAFEAILRGRESRFEHWRTPAQIRQPVNA